MLLYNSSFNSLTRIPAGIESVLVPIYVTEVAPIQLRGAAGVTPEIAVTGTLLLSQLLGISKVIMVL